MSSINKIRIKNSAGDTTYTIDSVPSGGTNGQVLTTTTNGVEWKDPNVPIASASTLGCVKQGENITISEDGTISTGDHATYYGGTGITVNQSTNVIDLKHATSTTYGGVLVDNETVYIGTDDKLHAADAITHEHIKSYDCAVKEITLHNKHEYDIELGGESCDSCDNVRVVGIQDGFTDCWMTITSMGSDYDTSSSPQIQWLLNGVASYLAGTFDTSWSRYKSIFISPTGTVSSEPPTIARGKSMAVYVKLLRFDYDFPYKYILAHYYYNNVLTMPNAYIFGIHLEPDGHGVASTGSTAVSLKIHNDLYYVPEEGEDPPVDNIGNIDWGDGTVDIIANSSTTITLSHTYNNIHDDYWHYSYIIELSPLQPDKMYIYGTGNGNNQSCMSATPPYGWHVVIDSVRIPSGTLTIGDYAFADAPYDVRDVCADSDSSSCSEPEIDEHSVVNGFTNINIPASVTTIGVQSFSAQSIREVSFKRTCASRIVSGETEYYVDATIATDAFGMCQQCSGAVWVPYLHDVIPYATVLDAKDTIKCYPIGYCSND